MKKFSKIISLFLVLALCLSTFIVSVSAVAKPKNYTLNLNAISQRAIAGLVQ